MPDDGKWRPVEALIDSVGPPSSIDATPSAALPEREDTRKAVMAAYAFLGRRAYSRAELRARLCRTVESAEAVEGALDWLVARRLVDDRRYAEEVVRAGAERKGWGRRKVRQWLGQHGVESSVADEAVSAISSEHEAQKASALAARQRARGRRADQIFRFLVTRGFSSDVARAAALRDDGGDDDAARQAIDDGAD